MTSSPGIILIFLILALGASCVTTTSATAATNGTWINSTSGGLWFVHASWAGGVVANGADAVADFSTLDITADNAVILDGAPTVGTLVFGDASPTNNWTVNNYDGGTYLSLIASSGSPTIQVNNQSVTFNCSLRGSQGLTKTGNGRLVLASENTEYFSGTIVINAGVVEFQQPLPNLTIGIATNSDGGIVFGPSVGVFSVESLSGTGNFALNDIGGGPAALQLDGIGNNAAYSGAMSGSGSLTVYQTGGGPLPVLTLNGANTVTGDTNVMNHGHLQLGNANALLNSTMNLAGAVTFAPGIGTFNLGGLSIPQEGLSPTDSLSLTDTAGAPVTLVVGSNDASTTCANVSGSGALVKVGSGILTLAMTTFTGGITVDGGALELEGTGDGRTLVKVSNSTVTVNSNGGLEFQAYNGLGGQFEVAGLAGSGDFSLTDTLGTPIDLLVGANNVDTTYSGIISGTTLRGVRSELAKLGTGTLTLSGLITIPAVFVSGDVKDQLQHSFRARISAGVR